MPQELAVNSAQSKQIWRQRVKPAMVNHMDRGHIDVDTHLRDTQLLEIILILLDTQLLGSW